jgi:hypothetical protein
VVAFVLTSHSAMHFDAWPEELEDSVHIHICIVVAATSSKSDQPMDGSERTQSFLLLAFFAFRPVEVCVI